LVELLKARGLTCWCDVDGLRGGVDYEQEILDAVRRADVVMPLLSQAALDSNFVRYEVGAARGIGKRVVQVLLDTLPLESLNEPFSARQQLTDLSGGISEGPALDRLVKDLTSWTTTAKGKRRVKAAVVVVAALLIFLGIRHLMLFAMPLGNLLVSQGPPTTGGASLITSANASEYSPSPLAYESPPPVQPDPNGLFHPQIAFEAFGLSVTATNWAPLGTGSSLHSGEHFFLRAETFTPGYLYIFMVDSGGKLQWIFPANPTFSYSYGTNVLPARAAITLPPNENQAYKLDDTTGEERVFAIYSATRWEKLEQALERAGDPKSPDGATREIQSLLAVTDALTDRSKGIATVEETHIARSVKQSTGADQDGVFVDLPAQSMRAKDHWLLEVRRFEHLPAASTKP
jgi:hypothetical protein